MQIRTLTLSAMFAALVTLFTLYFKISVGPGYYHLGDGLIYTAAILLGPWAGMVAGGLGSFLADMIGGYGFWAPWSLVIKGATGLIVGVLASGRTPGRDVIAMIPGALITIAGYGAVTWFVYGPGLAIKETYGNFAQTGVGIVVALILVDVLRRRLKPIR